MGLQAEGVGNRGGRAGEVGRGEGAWREPLTGAAQKGREYVPGGDPEPDRNRDECSLRKSEAKEQNHLIPTQTKLDCIGTQRSGTDP